MPQLTSKSRALGGRRPASEKALDGSARSAPKAAAGLTADLESLRPVAGNLALQRLLASRWIQPKLIVGSPDDVNEREADRMADSVVRRVPACECGGTCSTCQSTEPELVARAAEPSAGDTTPGDADAALASLGPGQPMNGSTRATFESAFGREFDDVRIHRDARAAEAARALGARAFTHGRDVVFGYGEYRPEQSEGRRILAHELAHVVQQGRASRPVIRRVGLEDPPEPPGPALSNRERIDQALESHDNDDIQAITDFSEATESERLLLMQYLLDQGWVGPLDEYALEAIWQSFGEGLLEVGTANVGLWNQSVERGARLTNLQKVIEFNSNFQDRAVGVTNEMLNDSEERLKSERARYGLTHTVETTSLGKGGAIRDETRGMQRNLATVGLAAAARQLAAKRGEIDILVERQSSYVRERCSRGECTETITDHAAHAEAGRQVERARRDYQILRSSLESRFPILAAYAEGSVSDLETIAEGPSSEAAEVLGATIDEKLGNIEEVRDGLSDETNVIWKLPVIVQITSAQMGIDPESLQAGFVKAQVDEVETDEELKNLLLGTLALGFGLLAAIPTGGGSLVVATAVTVGEVGAAAVSSYIAIEHLREYQFQAAAAGTDFDKARAVSNEDPSLFWLALDIIGAGVDLAAATGVFRALAPAARAATAAEASDDAVEAFVRAAEAECPEGAELAARVGENAERLRGGVSAERAFGAEGRAIEEVEEATAAIRLELEGTVAEVPTNMGAHHVKVTPGGWIARCSNPCTQLRDAFARELGQNPALDARLHALEERAARAAGAAPDPAAAEAIAREAAVLEGELRRLSLPIEGSVLRPGDDAASIMEVLASAAGHERGETEMLFRLSHHLNDADLETVRRIAADVAEGKALSAESTEEISRILEDLRELARDGSGLDAMKAVDPLTGEALVPGSDAHMRQLWYEYNLQSGVTEIPEEIDTAWEAIYRSRIEEGAGAASAARLPSGTMSVEEFRAFHRQLGRDPFGVFVYRIVDNHGNVLKYGTTVNPLKRVQGYASELGTQFSHMEVISLPQARAQALMLESALIEEAGEAGVGILNVRGTTITEMSGGAEFVGVVEVGEELSRPLVSIPNPRLR